MSGFRGQKPAHLIFFVIFANIRHNFFLSLSRQCRFFAGFFAGFRGKSNSCHSHIKKNLAMPRNGDFLAGEPIFYLIYLLIPGPNPSVRHSIFLLFFEALNWIRVAGFLPVSAPKIWQLTLTTSNNYYASMGEKEVVVVLSAVMQDQSYDFLLHGAIRCRIA